MPTVKKFSAFVIKMYFEDHNPPHVHVVTPETAALVTIATAEVIQGHLPAKVEKAATKWIASNRSDLMEKWEAYK